jgi:hypothetical protein
MQASRRLIPRPLSASSFSTCSARSPTSNAERTRDGLAAAVANGGRQAASRWTQMEVAFALIDAGL